MAVGGDFVGLKILIMAKHLIFYIFQEIMRLHNLLEAPYTISIAFPFWWAILRGEKTY